MPSERPGVVPRPSDIRWVSQRSMPRVGTAMTSGANGSAAGSARSARSASIRPSARSARWMCSMQWGRWLEPPLSVRHATVRVGFGGRDLTWARKPFVILSIPAVTAGTPGPEVRCRRDLQWDRWTSRRCAMRSTMTSGGSSRTRYSTRYVPRRADHTPARSPRSGLPTRRGCRTSAVVRNSITAPATAAGITSVSALRAGGVRTSSYSSSLVNDAVRARPRCHGARRRGRMRHPPP